MKKILVLLFFFLLPLIGYAQIVIEDRVEVNPSLQVPTSPGSTIEHIFTYTLSWTPDQYRRGNIQIVDCNDDTVNSGWSTSGITTISFVGNGRHHYLFQEQRWFYHNFLGWGWWDATLPGRLLQVFIDGVDLNHPQNILGSYNGVPNDFNLTLSGSICPNDFAELSIDNINWNYCNVPSFYYGDPLELNIIDGSEFAEFFDINTNSSLGSTVQLNEYEDIQNIGLIRKENAPLVRDIQIVKVKADINGVVDTSLIWYYPVFFTAETEVYPDSITTGEEAYIDIDFFSYCVSLPPETKINIEIIKGQEFGNLINPYTNEKTKTITNLDHWWGYVWVNYIADGISTEVTDSVLFKITTTDPDIDSSKVIFIYKTTTNTRLHRARSFRCRRYGRCHN